MVRTKSISRKSGVQEIAPRRQLAHKAIAKKKIIKPMMQLPPFFQRIMKEVNQVREIYEYVTPTWECKKEQIKWFSEEDSATILGVVIEHFDMKPKCGFCLQTGKRIEDTSILIQFPSDFPFSPPQITFKDKIDHPSIDSDCGYFGKGTQYWTPSVRLKEYLSFVQQMLHLEQ